MNRQSGRRACRGNRRSGRGTNPGVIDLAEPQRRVVAGEIAGGKVGDDLAGTQVRKEQRLLRTVCRRRGGGVRSSWAFVHSLSDALPPLLSIGYDFSGLGKAVIASRCRRVGFAAASGFTWTVHGKPRPPKFGRVWEHEPLDGWSMEKSSRKSWRDWNHRLVASSKRAVGGSGGFLKLLAGVLDHAIVKASGVNAARALRACGPASVAQMDRAAVS